ncbi:hypothetical protein B0J13DRAFT_493970 [Dactylonectria estremocensis]|uniref:Fungal N-terminal domain-containing protein n=1 Tax=Dactylonectria estremocensis TaxID=1079267 RepID=A0A9P9JGB8_9HYPO|nr:hypothetical protein B0J13DRAFT_493970 [Dactylonectria estremocensis]
MDPLSITVSAAALIGTAHKLSVWLYNYTQDVKNVDTKICDLSKEVTQLAGLLRSVENMVQKCGTQALTLAHLDDHMWHEIRTALSDCEANLDGLNRLVMNLSDEYDPEQRNLARLLKKPSIHFYLAFHKDEIADLTSKIYKSNCAMQTSLAVINVSLTFRTNISQESLFEELHILKGLVQESLKAAHRHEADSDPTSTRQSRNLQSLAKAAQHFHSTASSTASTQAGAGDRRSILSWGGSEIGELTDSKRERIEQWNALAAIDESGEESVAEGTLFSGHEDTTTVISSSDIDDLPQDQSKESDHQAVAKDEGDDDEVERDFLRNFEELADSSFMVQNYSKAEQCVRMAVERSTGDRGTDFKQLKIKLALCCCMQMKWDHAAGIIAALPKSRSATNLPLFHLLQAITLAHLENKRFAEAYDTCKTVLQGKIKILGRNSPEYYECLWIFATICEKKGDALEAEAVRHSIPRGWAAGRLESVQSPTEYILNHSDLVGSIFRRGHGDRIDSMEGMVQRSASPRSPTSSEVSSPIPQREHWSMLVPNSSSNGVQRAERDERKGTMIEETDTGKEFLMQTVSIIDGGMRPEAPSNQSGWPHEQAQYYPQFGSANLPADESGPAQSNNFNRTVSDTEAILKQRRQCCLFLPDAPPSRLTSPKKNGPKLCVDIPRVMIPLGEYGASDEASRPMSAGGSEHLHPSLAFGLEVANQLTRSRSQPNRTTSRREADQHSQNLGVGISDPARHTFRVGSGETDAASPSATSPGKAPFRPLSHQRLIDKVHRAQFLSSSYEETLDQEEPDQPRREWETSRAPQAYIEEVSKGLGDESYSTLEVVYAPVARKSPFTQFPSFAYPIRTLSPSVDLLSPARLRTRWTVQRDIGNVGDLRPFGPFSLPQFLPLQRESSNPDGQFIAVSIRFGATDSIGISTGGYQGVTICQIPMVELQDSATLGSSLRMRTLVRRMSPLFTRKESLLTDTSYFTVDLSHPRNLIDESGRDMTGARYLVAEEKELLSQLETEIRQIELAIANLLSHSQSLSSLDFASSLRLEGLVYTIPDFLHRMSWEIQSKALAECALMQHAKVIPHSSAVVQYYLDRGDLVISQQDLDTPNEVVVVLNCDEVLVDCAPFFLQLVSHDYVEITEMSTSYMAEMAGHKHAQAEFAKLVEQQLKLTVRQLRRRIDTSTVENIMKSCCNQFQQRILPGFDNDGIEWTVSFEMPHGIPGFQHGQLEFTNKQILQCFTPGVAMITKMLVETALKAHRLNHRISNILLVGSYSKSKYLVKQLRGAIDDLRLSNGDTITLLQTSDGDNLCMLGALSHVRSS